MYDLFLKLVRQELASSSLINIHSIKINEYKAYMRNNLRELINLDEKSLNYFNKMLKNVFKDLDLLIRLRIVKAALGSEICEEGLDIPFLKMIEKIVEYIRVLYSGFVIENENNIAVRFKKNCYVDNRMYRKGDLVFLNNIGTFHMFMNDCIELVIEPYVRDKIRLKYLEDKS